MNVTGLNKRKAASRLGMSDRAFDMVIMFIVTAFLVVVIYPLIYVVSSSFSSASAVLSGKVLLWPVELSVASYEMVFKNRQVWTGYANTIFYVITETAINLFGTTLVSYVLSRKTFQARKFFTLLYIIPMWFGGGLIPTYMLMSNLGVVNSRWGYVWMATVRISDMIIMRTYFQSSIPGELLEAGKVDGISDIGYLTKVAIPLAKPVISVVTLYSVVAHWNSYFNPLVYLRDEALKPLQLVIRSIMVHTEVAASTIVGDQEAAQKLADAAETMKFSLIVVSAVPMLVLYPFVQKFFSKGVMMGSLKG